MIPRHAICPLCSGRMVGSATLCRRCFNIKLRARAKSGREHRFWSKVDKSGKCWIWKSSKQNNGYGTFGGPRSQRTQTAHRVAWELTNGTISDNSYVLHKCDTRLCVNPGHLWLGTQAENLRDMACKGRGWWQHGQKNIS